MINGYVIYLNLTNGLEALEWAGNEYKVCRIQSTACEQKRWDFILLDLDYNLLYDLAIGKTCFIVDYSQRKKIPRALFQGVEWVKYALTRSWFGIERKVNVRGNDATDYFKGIYDSLHPNVLGKLRYFKKFVICKEVDLISIAGKTTHDGDYRYYWNIIKSLGV